MIVMHQNWGFGVGVCCFFFFFSLKNNTPSYTVYVVDYLQYFGGEMIPCDRKLCGPHKAYFQMVFLLLTADI